jgi:NAD(P)-binding Rossmann-like domain
LVEPLHYLELYGLGVSFCQDVTLGCWGRVLQLAIVGGGPGGLMMAHLLERFPLGLLDVTLFEATAGLGGKILTQRFDTIPAIYEAGVAETL